MYLDDIGRYIYADYVATPFAISDGRLFDGQDSADRVQFFEDGLDGQRVTRSGGGELYDDGQRKSIWIFDMTKKCIRRGAEGNNKAHKTMPSSTLGLVRTRQMYAKPGAFSVDQLLNSGRSLTSVLIWALQRHRINCRQFFQAHI